MFLRIVVACLISAPAAAHCMVDEHLVAAAEVGPGVYGALTQGINGGFTGLRIGPGRWSCPGNQLDMAGGWGGGTRPFLRHPIDFVWSGSVDAVGTDRTRMVLLNYVTQKHLASQKTWVVELLEYVPAEALRSVLRREYHSQAHGIVRDDGDTLALLVLRSAAETVQRIEVRAPAMTNEDVIKLTTAGLENDQISRLVSAAVCVRFDLTVKGALALLDGGVAEDVIEAMMNRAPRRAVWCLTFPRTRKDAIDAAVALGARAVPMLVDGLSDSNSRVRSGCCEALGRIGSAAATRALRKRLRDDDPAARKSAARALRLIEDKTGTGDGSPHEALRRRNSEAQQNTSDILTE